MLSPRLITVALAGALLVSTVELACVAQREAPARPHPFTGALEPELPSASEIEDGEVARGPVLTR